MFQINQETISAWEGEVVSWYRHVSQGDVANVVDEASDIPVFACTLAAIYFFEEAFYVSKLHNNPIDDRTKC
jgi:hypothetical protein